MARYSLLSFTTLDQSSMAPYSLHSARPLTWLKVVSYIGNNRGHLGCKRRLTRVPCEDVTPEAYLAHLSTELEPLSLGEDGAEVPEETLHALLALLGHAPRAQHRQIHPTLATHLDQGEDRKVKTHKLSTCCMYHLNQGEDRKVKTHTLSTCCMYCLTWQEMKGYWVTDSYTLTDRLKKNIYINIYINI